MGPSKFYAMGRPCRVPTFAIPFQCAILFQVAKTNEAPESSSAHSSSLSHSFPKVSSTSSVQGPQPVSSLPVLRSGGSRCITALDGAGPLATSPSAAASLPVLRSGGSRCITALDGAGPLATSPSAAATHGGFTTVVAACDDSTLSPREQHDQSLALGPTSVRDRSDEPQKPWYQAPGQVTPISLQPVKSKQGAGLSKEQKRAVELAQSGRNIFLTGPAGVGKSYLVQALVQSLECHKKVVKTASTGIAASNIEGTTYHWWAGIDAPSSYDDFLNVFYQSIRGRITDTDALFIDEVSMMSGEMFDCLELAVTLARCYGELHWSARNLGITWQFGGEVPFHQLLKRRQEMSDVPAWGRLQLVLIGDFFQLPPIERRPATVTARLPLSNDRIPFMNRGYAFQASAWNLSQIVRCELTKPFRQKNATFVKLLNSIRCGRPLRAHERQLFNNQPKTLPPRSDGIQPTRLYCTNAEVDRLNREELQKLPGETVTFISSDSVEVDKGTIATAERDNSFRTRDPIQIEEQLEQLLRREAKAFWQRDCRAMRQIDLKVGAQVVLLANLDVQSKLVNGSRGVVVGFEAPSLWSMDLEPSKVYPKVQFSNGTTVVVEPWLFRQDYFQLGKALRLQVPLAIAWGLTIHKSQGSTLGWAVIDCHNSFAEGQVYTALSRCTSLQNFAISSENIADQVKTSPLVQQYYSLPLGSVFPHWNGERDGHHNAS